MSPATSVRRRARAEAADGVAGPALERLRHLKRRPGYTALLLQVDRTDRARRRVLDCSDLRLNIASFLWPRYFCRFALVNKTNFALLRSSRICPPQMLTSEEYHARYVTPALCQLKDMTAQVAAHVTMSDLTASVPGLDDRLRIIVNNEVFKCLPEKDKYGQFHCPPCWDVVQLLKAHRWGPWKPPPVGLACDVTGPTGHMGYSFALYPRDYQPCGWSPRGCPVGVVGFSGRTGAMEPWNALDRTRHRRRENQLLKQRTTTAQRSAQLRPAHLPTRTGRARGR